MLRKETSDELQVVCDICGRHGPYDYWGWSLDMERWDKTDFSILDHNPNAIIVTERVAECITKNYFTNIEARRVN